MSCKSSSCNKSEAICVKQLVMYLNTWGNKLLLLHIVNYNDTMFPWCSLMLCQTSKRQVSQNKRREKQLSTWKKPIVIVLSEKVELLTQVWDPPAWIINFVEVQGTHFLKTMVSRVFTYWLKYEPPLFPLLIIAVNVQRKYFFDFLVSRVWSYRLQY